MRRRHALGPVQLAIIDVLAPGKWVHGAKIVQATGTKHGQIWHAIDRLRARGFTIEGDRGGQDSRGYRMTFDPRRARNSTISQPEGAGRANNPSGGISA